MPCEFKVVRRVEFSETDMAGIVHYSNFFRYMETAEHGFFRRLGYSVVMNEISRRRSAGRASMRRANTARRCGSRTKWKSTCL